MQGVARKHRTWCVGIAGFAGLVTADIASAQPRLEKTAETVANVAAFARWPQDPGYGLSFRICLRETDPAFGDFVPLERTTIHGKPVTVHSMGDGDFGLRPCHVAYFSDGHADPRLVRRLRGTPTLTMSSQDGFERMGGMIGLRRDGTGYRLIVERRGLGARPVKLSAQLLAMTEEGTP